MAPKQVTSSLMQDEHEHEQQQANSNVNLTEPLIINTNTSPNGITETEAPQPGYNDEIADMTYSRRIARSLSWFNWYHPRKYKEKAKSILDDGWAYFEHITLARHFIPPEDRTDGALDRAEPGEWQIPTKLYSVWSTPHHQLGDFGIGIGIYFDTTWWLAFITFFAGCISTYNCYYYYHGDYTTYTIQSESESTSSGQEDLEWFLKGSAVCTDQIWVPCIDCTKSQWDDDGAPDRYAEAEAVSSNQTLVFALHNDCSAAEVANGTINLSTIAFLAISLLFMSRHQRKTEVNFDEDEQTAQDYSIMVDGCPPDALDPDEWKDFFTEVSESKVTMVTIAVDNAPLLKALVAHRKLRRKLQQPEYLKKLRVNLGWKKRLDNDADVREMLDRTEPLMGLDKFFARIGLGDDIRSLYVELIRLNDLIRDLADQDYDATDVFVTFETEAGQRRALQEMSVGQCEIFWNRSTIPRYCKFRGTTVLEVIEPTEPSTIRWFDLSVSNWDRIKGLIISTILSLVTIAGSVAFLMWRVNSGDSFIALYIAAMNVVVPAICKYIVKFEAHPDQGDRSMSLYFKITIFRWINTAVIIFLATPFTHTLSSEKEDLIPHIYTIFLAELISAPLIATIDISGFFKKHVLAPRQSNQDDCNACFRGAPWELAERYTTVTKLLFLCFFYAVLFPLGYFVCSAALFLTYYVDKFCLMRVWEPAAHIGTKVAEMNRALFFPLCILALFIVNSYHYARFPYDNLCATNQTAGLEYAGSYTIYTEGNVNDEYYAEYVTIYANDTAYKYCDQDILSALKFPATSKTQSDDATWMTDDQETLVDIFGWSGFGGVLAILTLKYGVMTWSYLCSCFRGTYEPSGKDMKINFSSLDGISAYVPQIRYYAKENFPLIATNYEDIDLKFMDWEDPDGGYEKWDLRHEIPEDLMKRLKKKRRKYLSIVKHYPLMPSIQRILDREMVRLLEERSDIVSRSGASKSDSSTIKTPKSARSRAYDSP
eukprot:CAMPEP_0116013916 /NCGR_PEP_ID=MMETSP0321-20121206/5992_1 /TAXON_ID=163516 /ORGANISM="Leptocylindrus danicus var. danicus, Strain B650" /LENGTH=992 /DNA_ID=CAMNT_0003483519 /DNA_START=31 /DNA_END=3010 /DNA_ORIENTATION=+